MPRFKIKSEKIAGFCAADKKPGEQMVQVCTKVPLLTSDEPSFYVLMTQVNKVFLSRIQYPADMVSRLLVVLHADDSADIFINDFNEIAQVQVNRPVAKGEAIYDKDVRDIKGLRFPDIEIKSDDAILFCTKVGWKFGLYFDFERNIDLDRLSGELGDLKREMFFKKDVSSVDFELCDNPRETLILTEGKTDWKHLKKAKEVLGIELPIRFDEFTASRGDVYTLRMCKNFSEIPDHPRMVFIFDRDNPEVIKELDKKTVDGTCFQDWGNNVFSFYLPVPTHRKKYANISIEFYYTDAEIRAVDLKTGKRLLFSNEVEERVIKSMTSREYSRTFSVLPTPKLEEEYEKKIFDGACDEIKDDQGVLISHSKEVFASNIVNGAAPFDRIQFGEFRNIFDIIAEILKRRTDDKM